MPNRRLPVWAVVRRSYGYVWERRVLLAIPLLLIFLANLAAALYAQTLLTAVEQGAPLKRGLLQLVNLVLIAVSMTVIVGIHRTVLLDEVRSGLSFPRFDRYLWNYAKTWLLLGAIALLFIVIFVLLVAIIGLAAGFGASSAPGAPVLALAPIAVVLLLGIVFVRFMMALPAAALGEKDGLGVSWQATRGNWGRLLATTFLAVLPFIIAGGLLAIPALVELNSSALRSGTIPSIHQPLAILILSSLIKSVDLAVMTVMLSLSYDVLVRGGGPPETRA